MLFLAHSAIQAEKLKRLVETIENQTENIEAFLEFQKAKGLKKTKSLTVQRLLRQNVFTIFWFTECKLPRIGHLRAHHENKFAHNASVELACAGNRVHSGVTTRKCQFGDWSPDFTSHPFACKSCLI